MYWERWPVYTLQQRRVQCMYVGCFVKVRARSAAPRSDRKSHRPLIALERSRPGDVVMKTETRTGSASTGGANTVGRVCGVSASWRGSCG